MKLRRTLNFHSLRKGKVRMTWNKYNLYNLSNVNRRIPNFIWKTFFQQKWAAKALARAYHGEHIKEKKWTRMFERRLRSVVDMNPMYMALNDGAEQATGRGSGLERPRAEDVAPYRDVQGKVARSWKLPGGIEKFEQLVDKDDVTLDPAMSLDVDQTNVQQSTETTPYMNMTFAPIERRIDVAIFRAMFASSARQARNLVIHGKVKVNGQPMNHATYLLNPGDMFQVEPDAVMTATGMPKQKIRENPAKAEGEKEEKTARKRPGRKRARKSASVKAKNYEKWQAKLAKKKGTAGGGSKAAAIAPEADEGSLEPAQSAVAAVEQKPEKKPEEIENLQKRLKNLALKVRGVLHNEGEELPVKRKQRLRNFINSAKQIQAKINRNRNAGEQAIQEALEGDDIVSLISQTLKDMAALDSDFATKAEASGMVTSEEAAAAKKASGTDRKGEEGDDKMELSDRAEQELRSMVREYEDNPYDPSKPYKTPWEPRNYMSAFAFVPRYLEVNPNICAAVYLRHPVARQGMAEIPSPFPVAVQELAFNWYLRRR